MYKLNTEWTMRKIEIALIGCGGTGSFVCQQLIALSTSLEQLGHPGLSVRMYDPSKVSQANLVRQHFLPFQVGENKAEALAFIANNLHEKDFTFEAKAYDPKTNYNQFDLLITCLDRPSVRYEISKTHSNKTLWLDTGNGSHSGNVVLGDLRVHNKQLPNICDLYDYSELSDEDALVKSCSAEQSISRQEFGVNSHAANHAISILWNLIRRGSIEHHGVHFDIREGRVDPIKVCPKEWATYPKGFVLESEAE